MFDFDDFVVGVFQDFLFVVRNDYVVEIEGDVGVGCVGEGDFFDVVEYFYCQVVIVFDEVVVDQCLQVVFFEQVVDEGEFFGECLIEDDVIYGCFDDFVVECFDFGVDDVLVVELMVQVDVVIIDLNVDF